MVAKRFNSRRVLLVHGGLLLAVVITAYLSVRAQYQTLSDQALADAQSDLELITHAAADSVQQQIRLIVSGLWDFDYAERANPPLPDSYVSALVTVDRQSVRVLSHQSGDAGTVEKAIAQVPWLSSVKGPTIATVLIDDVTRVLVAVPMRGGSRTAVALLSPGAVAADLTSAAPRDNPPTMYLVDNTGRIFAANASSNAQWLQPALDPELQDKLNATLKLGGTGTSVLADTGGDEDAAKLMTVRALEPINGYKWLVVAVKGNVRQSISHHLRPVFWQLISLSGLMVVATAIVMVSTTVSLRRGSRRIERLRAQMLERDLQKARTIQLNWLPAPVLHMPHVSIAAENRPASHISGDFYNWFELPAGEEDGVRKTVVVIGDVSGHGLPAAFLMATTQLLVRNTMPTVRDPGECLAEVNRQLCSLVYQGQFVTMMIMTIDHELSAIEVASAGQAAPLLRRDGQIEEIPVDPQLVVGVDRSVEYPTHRIRIRGGDMMLLYTDGAVESKGDHDMPYGLGRLGESIRHAGDDAESVVKSAVQSLIEFCGDEFDDDLTLVAIQLAAKASVDEPAPTIHEGDFTPEPAAK